MGEGSWGDDWRRGDDPAPDPAPLTHDPTSASVFADPHRAPSVPDEWDDDGWEAEDGAGYGWGGGDAGGIGPAHGGYEDGYDDDGYEEPGGIRRGLVSATVVVLALLLGVGLAAVFERRGNDSDDALDTGRATSSTSSTTVEVTPTIGGLPGQPETDVASASSSTSSSSSSSTTSVKPAVKASTSATPPTTKKDEPPEPACASGGGGEPVPWQGEWESRWTSKPQPNDPATISICIDDRTPKVGQKVTVTLKAADPDAVITEQECGYLVAWDGNLGNLCRDTLDPADGPRRTPPEQPGDVLVRFTHVFTEADGVTVAGAVISSRWEGYESPYSSRAQAFLKVAVHD